MTMVIQKSLSCTLSAVHEANGALFLTPTVHLWVLPLCCWENKNFDRAE